MLEPVLMIVPALLLLVRLAWGWKLPVRAQLVLAYVVAGLFALWALFGALKLTQGDPRPLLPLAVLIGILWWGYRRALASAHTFQPAGADDFERLRSEVNGGLALGFTTARVDHVAGAAGSKILMLTMLSPADVVYSVQLIKNRTAVSFSTYFDDGELDLVTQNYFGASPPRAVERVLDGSPAELLAAHRADTQTLIRAGHHSMSSQNVDLYAVNLSLMNRHSADMSRQMLRTLWRIFVPDAASLKSLELRVAPRAAAIVEF